MSVKNIQVISSSMDLTYLMFEHFAAIFRSFVTHGTMSKEILCCTFLPLFKHSSPIVLYWPQYFQCSKMFWTLLIQHSFQFLTWIMLTWKDVKVLWGHLELQMMANISTVATNLKLQTLMLTRIIIVIETLMLKLNLMIKLKLEFNFPINIVVKHNKPRNVVTEKNRHCERSNFTFTRHNYLKQHQLHCQAKLPKKLDTQNYIKLMQERNFNFSDMCAINRFNRKRFGSPSKHCQIHEKNDCCETLFVVLNPSKALSSKKCT